MDGWMDGWMDGCKVWGGKGIGGKGMEREEKGIGGKGREGCSVNIVES